MYVIEYLKHSIWDLYFVWHVAALALTELLLVVTKDLAMAHYSCDAQPFDVVR